MGYRKLKNIICWLLTFIVFAMIFVVYKYTIASSLSNLEEEVGFVQNLIYFFASFILIIFISIFLLTSYFFNRIEILEKEMKFRDSLITNYSKSNEIKEIVENILYQWNKYLLLFKDRNNDNIENQEQMINDFQDFYITKNKKENFTLEKVIDLNMKLISSTLKKNNVKINSTIPEIGMFGLKNHLARAILNILNNSNDVFSKNYEKNVNNNYIEISVFKEIESIIIIIHDNAGGIPDQYLDKVFEKYFTTKDHNRGIGEGLYISKKIIEQDFNGTINVKNEGIFFKNKKYLGAKFIIKMPSF